MSEANKIDDGGEAFPSMEISTDFNRDDPDRSGDTYSHSHASGMSLRDYFAAKAISVIVRHCIGSNDDDSSVNVLQYDTGEKWKREAVVAYAIADAMLAARSAATKG